MSLSFLVVVLAVVAVPGVDFIVTLRNTIAAGRGAGTAAAVGIGVASALQGTLVSIGLGAVIVRSQPMFLTLKWVGIAYLVFLGFQALRSAWRGTYIDTETSDGSRARARAFRQGFLGNITNPKILVFYLSLLPQFVGGSASLWTWLSHAWTLPALGTTWLLLVVVLGRALRERLLRPFARRVVDALSGVALLGFGVRLASQR